MYRDEVSDLPQKAQEHYASAMTPVAIAMAVLMVFVCVTLACLSS